MFLTTYYNSIAAQRKSGLPTMDEARRDHTTLQERRVKSLASSPMH